MEIKVSIKFQFEKIGEEIKVSMKPKNRVPKVSLNEGIKRSFKKGPQH